MFCFVGCCGNLRLFSQDITAAAAVAAAVEQICKYLTRVQVNVNVCVCICVSLVCVCFVHKSNEKKIPFAFLLTFSSSDLTIPVAPLPEVSRRVRAGEDICQ